MSFVRTALPHRFSVRSTFQTVFSKDKCSLQSHPVLGCVSVGTTPGFDSSRRRNNSTVFLNFSLITTTATQPLLSECTLSNQQRQEYKQIRWFESVSEFHDEADEALETIQDAIESLFESLSSGKRAYGNDDHDDANNFPEINLSDGVLTLSLGKHGTWVINKQTPNRQIWWSSPISGPRRYEYDEDAGFWVYTRFFDAKKQWSDVDEEQFEEDGGVTLGSVLKHEIKLLYGLDLDLDV